MKIITFVRSADVVTVVYSDAGKIVSRHFPKTLTDAAILAELRGEPAPAEPAKAPAKREPVKTIPEPPAIPKERMTRQQMIEALAAAGITGVDTCNRESLTAAYAALKQQQKGGK
jgi:hypothetical protein